MMRGCVGLAVNSNRRAFSNRFGYCSDCGGPVIPRVYTGVVEPTVVITLRRDKQLNGLTTRHDTKKDPGSYCGSSNTLLLQWVVCTLLLRHG